MAINLLIWQTIYLISGVLVLPFSPFLYVQGQLTRRRVGVLPGAAGEKSGTIGDGGGVGVNLLVIGESTVAGLGARTHEFALAGQFAKRLSLQIGKTVNWTVIGKNGVTARRTIDELVPLIPDETYDHILVGLGGNDVMRLSSPRKWRRDMTELLGILRKKNPNAVFFLSNCPMIKLSTAIPHPIKFLLWELSKLHDANIKDLTSKMDRVFYYHQPRNIVLEGFFADGIHPSEKGYSDWSESMMKFFTENYKW
ncbi:MAG: SGNH/GDSL hydrolase family protein [Saprospiraceae bacterium]|nr:SGNH/GDSL hydrolase family protein [Pyrinomonadaceae bacterium]